MLTKMVKRKSKSGKGRVTNLCTKRVLHKEPTINTEIVFSFDTTGSMSGCIAQVRARVQEVIQRLLSDIEGLRIAVVAHGDYCDGNNVIHWRDFTKNTDELCDFVNNAPNTGGGDWPECYELVLNRVRLK
jgi:hypothetical protein